MPSIDHDPAPKNRQNPLNPDLPSITPAGPRKGLGMVWVLAGAIGIGTLVLLNNATTDEPKAPAPPAPAPQPSQSAAPAAAPRPQPPYLDLFYRTTSDAEIYTQPGSNHPIAKIESGSCVSRFTLSGDATIQGQFMKVMAIGDDSTGTEHSRSGYISIARLTHARAGTNEMSCTSTFMPL